MIFVARSANVFFIGFMLLLGVSFSTAINLKFISGYRQLGNVLSSLACLSSMFMSALGLMLINDGVIKSITPVLSDWRILPVLTVEFTSFYFAKKNTEAKKKLKECASYCQKRNKRSYLGHLWLLS